MPRFAVGLRPDARWGYRPAASPDISPALTHGLGKEDILHAYRNAIRVWPLGDGFTMVLGPNAAAIILDVGYVEGNAAVDTVYAMRARKRFLE